MTRETRWNSHIVGRRPCRTSVRRHSRFASDPVYVRPEPMLRPSSAASTAVAAERREHRHEQERGRQVCEEVGQHGGQDRDQQEGAVRRAFRQQVAHPVAERPHRQRRDDDAEAEHEHRERRVGRRARPASR